MKYVIQWIALLAIFTGETGVVIHYTIDKEGIIS
jgi:hypothetical protein